MGGICKSSHILAQTKPLAVAMGYRELDKCPTGKSRTLRNLLALGCFWEAGDGLICRAKIMVAGDVPRGDPLRCAPGLTLKVGWRCFGGLSPTSTVSPNSCFIPEGNPTPYRVF